VHWSWRTEQLRSWAIGTPRRLGWLGIDAAGQGVLGAVDVGILVAGVKRPRWRRAAVIAAWTLILVGFAWFFLTGRMSSAG
jgi:hypothetical protein